MDRDGVLIHDTHYPHTIEDCTFYGGAFVALPLLQDAGYDLFLVINQSGIGRGLYTVADFETMNNYMNEELAKRDIVITKTYFCPHTPGDNCSCRKPKTQFIEDAVRDFHVDVANSYVIGDKATDVEMGKRAGCSSILVLTGHGLEERANAQADFVAQDVLDAAQLILRQPK